MKLNIIDFKKYWLEFIFILVIVIGLLYSFSNITGLVKSMLYLARITSYILFSISISRENMTNHHKFLSLKSGYFLASLLILGWGFIQYFLIPDVRFLSVLGWDDHYYRLISTQFDPAFSGMIFVLGFSYLLSFRSMFKKNNYFFYLFYFSLIYGVLLTFSRASFISLFSLLLLNIFIIKNSVADKFKLALTIFIFIFMIIVVPKNEGEGNKLLRTSTIDSRLVSDRSYFDFDKPHQWLVGKGIFINTNRLDIANNDSKAQVPDNIFTTIFTGTGIIGLMISIILIFKWGIKLFRLSPSFFAITASLLIHSQFNNTFLQPFVFLMWLGGLVTTIQEKTNT